MYLVRLHYGGSTRVKSGKGIITARCTLVQTAKRGIAIAYRLSVCLSVTMVDCDHIGWNSSKIISALVSLGCSIANAAEWLQIAQRPQWRAYRKLPVQSRFAETRFAETPTPTLTLNPNFGKSGFGNREDAGIHKVSSSCFTNNPSVLHVTSPNLAVIRGPVPP